MNPQGDQPGGGGGGGGGAASSGCSFSAPDVVFPSDALLYAEDDLSDKAQGTLSLQNLDVSNYHYFVLAQTDNRGFKKHVGAEVTNGDDLVEIYRSVNELLYGTDGYKHMGSTTYADIQGSSDDDYSVTNSADETYEVILGAASRCSVGRVGRDGTIGDVYLRAAYRATVTLEYHFTHGIDASDFTGALDSTTSVTNAPVMLVQHEDQIEQSQTQAASQTVERQDIVISSSLTPYGLGANGDCLDIVTNPGTITSGTDNTTDSPGIPSHAFSGQSCEFIADVHIARTTENGVNDASPDHEDHVELLQEMHVEYAMSQYAQQGENLSVVNAASKPGDFNCATEGVDDGGDMRYDVCWARVCGPDSGLLNADCTDDSGGITISGINLLQQQTSTEALVQGNCSFNVFAMDNAELTTPSYSPYAYVRAWFSWDDGQVHDVAPQHTSDDSDAQAVNEPLYQSRRLLRSAKKIVKATRKPLVQHTFRFKLSKVH